MIMPFKKHISRHMLYPHHHQLDSSFSTSLINTTSMQHSLAMFFCSLGPIKWLHSYPKCLPSSPIPNHSSPYHFDSIPLIDAWNLILQPWLRTLGWELEFLNPPSVQDLITRLYTSPSLHGIPVLAYVTYQSTIVSWTLTLRKFRRKDCVFWLNLN